MIWANMMHLHFFVTFSYISAAFGGVIGLCSGFSLLSGVELLYWFTIRLFVDYMKTKNRKPKKPITHKLQ